MKIESIGKAVFKITLSSEELEKSGLPDTAADHSELLKNPLISGIIDKLTQASDSFLADDMKIGIELLSLPDKSCIIYIFPSRLSSRKRLRAVITADSLKRLAQITQLLKSSGISAKDSMLTGNSRCLRLIIALSENQLYSKPMSLIRELVGADELLLAHISEHDRIIIPDNALDELDRLISLRQLPQPYPQP